jgi:RNA 2',3'-cyclic 3'-phosphodiesterase
LSGEPTRRLFFALWPDGAQRTALVHATSKVVRHCGGRPVPAESLHVTLAFLGAVAESRIALLSALAQRAAAGFAGQALPLSLAFARFAYWTKPQILAVLERAPADGDAAASGVATLAGVLTRECMGAGFSPDLKPFRAHVTVARKVTRAPRAAGVMHEVPWSFGGFALIESRTLPSGPVYSVVESHVLGSVEKVST